MGIISNVFGNNRGYWHLGRDIHFSHQSHLMGIVLARSGYSLHEALP